MYLQPQYFDSVTQACLYVAFPYMDDIQDLKSPSNALKLKYDLLRLCKLKWGMCVKENSQNNDEAKASKNFLKLVENEYKESVTVYARNVLLQRSFTKDVNVPNPKDICDLTIHIIKELKEQKLEVTLPVYRRVICLVMTRLLMFNKRRASEIDHIT